MSQFVPLIISVVMTAASITASLLLSGSRATGGAKLYDTTVHDSSWGKSISRVFGGKVRLAGNVIWASNFIEYSSSSGGKGGGSESTGYTYYCSFATAFCKGPVEAIEKIWFGSKLVYNTSGDGQPLDIEDISITIYLGTSDQEPDPVMESYEGSGNVPGHRDLAYIVVDNVNVSNFGNSLPTCSAQIVVGSETVEVTDALSNLMTESGLEETDYDTAELSGLTCGGLFVTSAKALKTTVQAVLQAKNAYTVESDGVIKFQLMERSALRPIVPVLEQDLGCGEAGGDTNAFELKILKDTDLPKTVTVSYQVWASGVSSDDGHTVYTMEQGHRKLTRSRGTSKVVESFDLLDLVMTDDEAYSAVKELLRNRLRDRMQYKLSLPFKYLQLDPGDVISLTNLGYYHLIRIVKQELGDPGIINIEGVGDSFSVPTPPPSPVYYAFGVPVSIWGSDDLVVANGYAYHTAGGNYIWKLDLHTHQVDAEYTGPVFEGHTAIESDGSALYVMSSGSTDFYLQKIDTATMSLAEYSPTATYAMNMLAVGTSKIYGAGLLGWGLYVWDKATLACTMNQRFAGLSSGEVKFCCLDSEENCWVVTCPHADLPPDNVTKIMATTPDGSVLTDPLTGNPRVYDLSDQFYHGASVMLYDSITNCLFIGGTDSVGRIVKFSLDTYTVVGTLDVVLYHNYDKSSFLQGAYKGAFMVPTTGGFAWIDTESLTVVKTLITGTYGVYSLVAGGVWDVHSPSVVTALQDDVYQFMM